MFGRRIFSQEGKEQQQPHQDDVPVNSFNKDSSLSSLQDEVKDRNGWTMNTAGSVSSSQTPPAASGASPSATASVRLRPPKVISSNGASSSNRVSQRFSLRDFNVEIVTEEDGEDEEEESSEEEVEDQSKVIYPLLTLSLYFTFLFFTRFS